MDSRISEGLEMLESIWFSLACRVIDSAIQVYKLNTEQANALREVYLKPNQFRVFLELPH
jgi:hypothetical protein